MLYVASPWFWGTDIAVAPPDPLSSRRMRMDFRAMGRQVMATGNSMRIRLFGFVNYGY